MMRDDGVVLDEPMSGLHMGKGPEKKRPTVASLVARQDKRGI